jgi:hypothetical protein
MAARRMPPEMMRDVQALERKLRQAALDVGMISILP